MTYYPKSQIKTNLYTNGGEYILSTTEQIYKGYFYEVSNGNKYTGTSPSNPPNILLLPKPSLLNSIGNGPDDVQGIITIQEFSYTPSSLPFDRSIPSPIQPLPTQQDKDLGVFPRYFCKKNNENIYIEIDKEQFTKLQSKDKTIAWDLYTPKQVLWQIKGDKTQTYNANKNNVSLIEQRDKWYGFTQYFKDRFLKYYLES